MVPLTPFVGRAGELAEIAARLEKGARLVTILGTGGIGKTALARRAANELAPRHRFLELASVSTVDDLRLLLAAAFEAEPADLASAIEQHQGELLILDNFEQLLPAGASLLFDLITATSSARFLITSREPLRLSFEERIEVPPLTEEEGSLLFRERCASLSVTIDSEDREVVSEVVRRLDGIPLAIELAASRAPLLGPQQILERLSDLGPASRDRPDRQATLQSTIDWSWNMLTEAEQRVLAESAVFRGGFTVGACEAVVGRSIDSTPVIEILQSLREKSLLRTIDSNPRRLSHFEVIRRPMEERLADAAELRRRHAEHHLRLVEQLASELSGPSGAAAQMRFLTELENILAAQQYASADSPAISARILLAVHELLTLRGPFSSQLEMTSSALQAAERSKDTELIARAHLAHAQVYIFRRRLDGATKDLERALSAASASGSELLRGEVLRWKGIAAREVGRDQEADVLLTEALAIAEVSGDRLFQARCLSNLGTLRRFQLRDEEAVDLYERSLLLHRALGNDQGEVVALGNIGHLHAASGRLRAAVAAYREALEHRPERVDRRSEAIILAHLGGVEARLGEIEAAEAHEQRALATFSEVLDGPMEALACAHLGAIAAARRDFETAESWFARSRRIAIPDPGWRVVCELLEGLLHVARGDRDPAQAALASARTSMRAGAVYSEHVRHAAERLQSALDSGVPESQPSRPVVTVAADGSWFAIDAEKVDLSRRGALGRLLRCLLEKRLAAPDEPVSIEELLSAGWAGEKMLPEAGKTRIYSAVRTLRRFGLEQVLITRDGGYLLHPAAKVTRAP